MFFPLLPQESYTYKDPITEFVECLYVNFDFDSAQKKLRECESVRLTTHQVPACACVFVCVKLGLSSLCLLRSNLVGWRLLLLLLAKLLMYPVARNSRSIQPVQIHVLCNLLLFLRGQFQSTTAVSKQASGRQTHSSVGASGMVQEGKDVKNQTFHYYSFTLIASCQQKDLVPPGKLI